MFTDPYARKEAWEEAFERHGFNKFPAEFKMISAIIQICTKLMQTLAQACVYCGTLYSYIYTTTGRDTTFVNPANSETC